MINLTERQAAMAAAEAQRLGLENGAQNQPPPPPDNRTYDRDTAVSFETWQNELAFERTPGGERETKARNSGDARYWYDNYVKTWNNADAATRYSIDQQHGFFGGTLAEPPKASAPSAGEPSAPASTPPPAPRNSTNPPKPEDISPTPDPTSTNDGSDQTPEDDSTVIDTELVDTDPEQAEPSQDPDTNDQDDSLLTVRDVTPQDEVVDPATGRRYPTPADARRAGISNWVYAYEYEEDDTSGGG